MANYTVDEQKTLIENIARKLAASHEFNWDNCAQNEWIQDVWVVLDAFFHHEYGIPIKDLLQVLRENAPMPPLSLVVPDGKWSDLPTSMHPSLEEINEFVNKEDRRRIIIGKLEGKA